MAHSIALVPYVDGGRTVSRLAGEIVRCVKAAPESLQVDFPQVLPRYSTLRRAKERVAEVRAAMQDASRGFGAYTIEVNGRVVGVASYQQSALPTPWNGNPDVFLDGPMISVWLARPQTCGRPTHMLPALLEQGVKVLQDNLAVVGTPWTVVNTDNCYVAGVLAATRVLDGFIPADAAGVFSDIDGSQAARRVFVSVSSLEDVL